MSDNLKFFTVVGILIVGILALGWRQPLKYRFLSQAEIYELENPSTPTPIPVASPTPWMWDKERKTGLEQRPSRYRE
jgi:hypothetical protein